MKADFYAQRPLTINHKDVAVGELVASVETAGGIPVEKALNAIASGHATEEKRKPDAKPADAEAKK